MNRNIKRVAFALIMSASSFAGTVIWFNWDKTEIATTDREPVALLNDSTNEVQRKPVEQVIWENVTKNESLFAGEAIRTSSNAEAKIRLLKSGTVIHLEPDSLVVLEENEKGLSLDFLEGNLYVQSADGGAGGVTLKTGSGEVSLKSAELSLSKEQSGAVNMAVFKGSAELQQGDKKIALDKEMSATLSAQGLSMDKDRIQVLAPVPGEPVLLNLVRNESLEVSFRKIDPAYKVSVEWGSSRGSLKAVDAVANGDSGKLAFPAKSGKWFMRLTAKSEDAAMPVMSSNVMPVVISPKAAPTLVEPTALQPVIKGGADKPVPFRWLNRHKFISQVLEVASDQEFKNIKISKSYTDDTMKYEESLPQGAYFWRVTGYVESQGKKEALTSPAVRFMAQDQWELKAPVLMAPANQQHLSYLSTQKEEGVVLKWQAPVGVKKFDVLVQRKNDKTWENVAQSTLEVSLFRLKDLKPGLYRWRATSWHPENATKKDAAPWSFTVGDMPKVEWAENGAGTDSVYEYSTPQPSLRVQWKPSDRMPSSYRYKIIAKDAAAETSAWVTVKEPFFEATLPADGEYTAFVEAMNDRNQTVAASEGKSFNVKKFLLPPAPNFVSGTPENLQTDAKGNLKFAWEQVPNVAFYEMTLVDEGGKVVQKQKLTRTTASLERLKPGSYRVNLKSFDTKQRGSEKPNSKSLYVPATSDINAPKIKSMKVK